MIKIKKRSELNGAEKYGSCANCGSGTDEKEIYKLEFEDNHNNRISMSLCHDCMNGLGVLIYNIPKENNLV